MTKLFSTLLLSLVSILILIGCSTSEINQMNKRAADAVSIGDWGEASYCANQIYENLSDCYVENLVSLSLIYRKLATLTANDETKQNYIERMIVCYNKSNELDSKVAGKLYRKAHVDMAEEVQRNKMLLSKIKANDSVETEM